MTGIWPEMNFDKLRKGPRQNGISKLEPSEFQIGDDDETYMIGAEVGYVMGLEKVNDYLNVPRDHPSAPVRWFSSQEIKSHGPFGHVVSRNMHLLGKYRCHSYSYALRLLRLNRPFYWDIISHGFITSNFDIMKIQTVHEQMKSSLLFFLTRAYHLRKFKFYDFNFL